MTTALPTATMAFTDTARPSENGATPHHGMDRMRKVALTGGVLYLITFAASIPQLVTFKHLIDDPSGYISGHGSNTAILVGSLLEMITAAAGIGTAIVLYPVTRRISRTAGIGFVASRIVEACMILVGVLSVLSVLTLKSHYAGATGAQGDSLRVTGEALVALRQWTFLIGPGFIAGINALFLGYVMYRGKLVPRIIPTIGLIGAPFIILSAISTLFGGWAQTSSTAFVFGLLDVIWEFSLGVYLTFKGFKQVPAATND